MILTIDIGNSAIKYATFKNDELTECFATADKEELLNYLKNNEITSAGISSVVPEISSEIIKRAKKIRNLTLKIFDNNSKTNLKINYKPRNNLGIDRICSAEGAVFLLKKNKKFENTDVAVIDFGTATTINLIKYPNEFIGGAIAPGLNLMFSALKENTAKLPLACIDDYKGPIDNTTTGAIASGVVNSSVGFINQILRQIKIKYKLTDIKIFVTGGNASAILPFLKFDFTLEKHLVHYGIFSLLKTS